ncbi:MAG: hypothetical protein ACP5U2_01755 [Bryobacteraceae bacterium]
MRNALSRILAHLRQRSHPGIEELLMLATGSGEAPALARLHLERCPRCLRQVEAMAEQWRQLVHSSLRDQQSFHGREDLLEEILALIENWDPAPGAPSAAHSSRRLARHRAVARRLSAELEVQLGTLAASLTGPSRDHEAPVHAVLARSGQLLCTFLGYRAAARLSQAALKLAGTAPRR